jgi:hypothetical protein
MNADLYSNRVKIMYENVKLWHPGERRSPAKVNVSLGFPRSIALNLNRCEVEDRTLLDHTIWRVEGEPVVRIPTEAVGIRGKIPCQELDALIDGMIPHALQQLASDPFSAIRSKIFCAARKRSVSEQTDGVLAFQIR